MTLQEVNKARALWKQQCENIRRRTSVNPNEAEADRLKRIARARKDYAYFVSYYFPNYARCECAPFHLNAAKKIKEDKNIYAVFEWARGHAKSTHLGIFIPLWLKIQEPRTINVMVYVSKSEDAAITLLGDIQAELQYNQRYIQDFGKQKGSGSWADGEFITDDGFACFARGRGQSPRGLRYHEFRPDYIIVDDIDDDEMVNSEFRVRKGIRWVKEALFNTLDGGRGRFILVGNRISNTSILADFAKNTAVYHSKVNVYDKNGNVSWAAKWSKEEIQRIEQMVGYRAFQKEYNNNPITEGAVFRSDWIRYKQMLPLGKYDKLVLYIDPSWKSTTKNDYKAMKLWGSIGRELHCIKAFCRQCTVSEMVRWVYDLDQNKPQDAAILYYIEASFMQDTLLDEFAAEGDLRGYQLPLMPDRRKKPDKFQRIEAVSPLWERGMTYYNEELKDDPDMKAGIEQTLAFDRGSSANDDSPDADEGAIWMLQRSIRSQRGTCTLGKRTRPQGYY